MRRYAEARKEIVSLLKERPDDTQALLDRAILDMA